MSGKRISSPASTGGAGTFFEQHVDAYWLAQLLVRGIPPILHDCAVVEVHLQTEHLGWHTDDFLVIGQSGSGNRRKLAGQVKQTFAVSATDEECKKAIQDFWKDFKGVDHFLPAADRFALVTLRGTNTLLEDFAGLLECSRASRDGADFEHRLATPGFITKKAVQYCEEILTIIREIEGEALTAAGIWPFLRVLHVLSLDLNTATGQTEAMIKTLLAHSTGESNAIGAADTSWNSLLSFVGLAMPEARSFRRDDLPDDLRHRHSQLGGNEQRVLQALSDHSALVLRGIRSTIGAELHLQRAGLVQQLMRGLESSQVVLVSGPAGSGKSVVAKDAIGLLSTDHFAFGFRAEEFAQPHFDGTLQNAHIPASATVVAAILASQGRKVLLIESVERLLEKSSRDAFTDLLMLAVADKSWRIILTCRDYSSDLVRDCFLDFARVSHSVITIPHLDDSELAEAEAICPSLARPLSNPALRRILRNPYFLDKALQISWSEERTVPQSERDLRALFWQQIVRADDHVAGGMPRHREKTFEEIAVRRARALTMYVACDDLDSSVVANLQRDSLVIGSEGEPLLVAPAHDVLEDWAILRWIEEQSLTGDGSFRGLFTTIGTHPAIRRSYRKWLGELVERDPGAADRLFEDAVVGEGVPAQFRDDTLVSLLRAPSSPEFLERHSARLLENDQHLLRRVIHLIRVACVTTPAWVSGAASHGSLFNAPEGRAWPCVLQLVQAHVGEFKPQDCPLLLGLIEDWSRGVSVWTPYPDGAESVASIAHWLLPGFDNYQSEDQRKRTLQVIAKIPMADPSRFEALLRGTDEEDGRDRVGDEFREMVFAGTEGVPAARDLPDVVVSVAADYLLCSEDDLEQSGDYGGLLDLENLFGLKEGLSDRYFPASAYHGPFLPLLRFHSGKGLAFIIKIFNHSADWYVHPRVPERLEAPFEIELKFGDGTTRKQWGNSRLWNWYRGTSVGPDILLSLLMALERWLLEFAEARPRKLDAVLLDLLRRSESAAVTAVVASVATAFPHAAGESLLVLLRSPMCIQLDRQRMVSESGAPSRISDLMPQLLAENKFYDAERRDADQKTHRQSDLEAAIANLQLSPLASRVHEILDQHRAAMPPIAAQDDDDRVWRLAMHRMDLRQYTASEDEPTRPVVADGASPAEPTSRYIRLAPNDPEPDVKEMMDKSAVKFGAVNARLGLLNWGLHIFKDQGSPNFDPANWKQILLQARSSDAASLGNEESLGARNGPGIVAAVCVRDHWEEMSNDERDWCIAVACQEVMRQAEVWNPIERAQHFEMSADRPCASVLPLLFGTPLAEARRLHVQQAFVTGLTHSIDEVRLYAAWGVGEHLWSRDRALTLRCVNALAVEATLVQRALDAEERRPYDQRRQIDAIGAEAASVVRKRFWQNSEIAADAYETLDVTEWYGAQANVRILTILRRAPTEPSTVAGFAKAARTLVASWDKDDSRGHSRHQKNIQAELTVSRLLEGFLMRTSQAAAKGVLQPILDAIERHPDQIHRLVRGLTSAEDSEPNTKQFWFLWGLFAEKVRCASWLDGIDEEHSWGRELVSAIFLGTWWKEQVRHWRSLEGYAHHVHALFEDLPPSSTVLDDYVRFLYHIGEQSLPEGFIRIAKRLQLGSARQMLRKTDTVFMLEVLLQRYVYGKPLELKRERPMREAVLFLLDTLVENGSSAAFRMRDDFVTPVSVS